MNVVAGVRRWWERPAAPLLAVAAVVLAIHLATNGMYGLHTDELYYIVSGQHPAFGYVDYPPVTPMLARIDTSIFGISSWTLRLFPAITGAVVVFLTGMCAREMGGGRRASILASVVALMTPLLLGTWLFQTVEFDLLTWVIALYLLLRILRTGDPRLFILLGVDLGVGIETKTTILGLGAGIAVAMLVSRDVRPFLRTRYPWIGMIIALALAAPNVGWQIANEFPTLTYIRNHGSDIANGGGIVTFVELFILTMGPLLLPLWIAGLAFLFRNGRLRPIGVLTVVAILLFLPEGKGYYPAPTTPIVLAAGCVAAGGIVSRARWRWVVGLVVAAGLVEVVVLGTIILPLVPPSQMHKLGVDKVNPDFANTVGWPEMTAQVGVVYNALPADQRARTAILTSIDGQAGAIDIYGGSEHLPQAISPHLNFWYWKPANLDATTLVTVGYNPSDLEFLCGSITQAGNVTIPYSIDNLNQGAPILVCTNLKESIDAAWPALRNFS
ncbi:MAG: glycosyltransferase family 39 protein [Candidatus Dormiibacterota bacterium]